MSSTSTVPKSPLPLRAHFNTLPTRSTTTQLQVPQYPAAISRLGIPRSQSTSSLHDLVSDLRLQQQQQKHNVESEDEKKRLEASKSAISRHASVVVRYYNKAKSRSPSLNRALSSASPKKNKKRIPQSPPTKKPAQPAQSAPAPPSGTAATEPRLQRADSRVRVQLVPTPLLEPSAAVIEELSTDPPIQIAVIDEKVIEQKDDEHEEKSENYEENDDHRRQVDGKVHMDKEEAEDASENIQNDNTVYVIEPPQQRMPTRSMSSPPPNSTHSWYTLRSDETDAWIQQGIEYHEKGAIQQATLEFQRAANASSPIGLFLYGLSLRHGWGCKRSERTAFRYLQKSAEHAIFDLQKFVSGRGNKFIANRELVMAIYELGQAYCHGWGCHKDKKTAAYYFKIAADLGDADAQNEVARCYHHGQGFKKDMKLAAKYYRKADQQGHGMVGNSWIYKEKYGAPVQAGSSSS